MSYQIDADYTKVFMFPPSLEDFIGQDDPVRFIRTFVDSLDLKGMGFKVRENPGGRPGFAASLLLKIWLFGSFERVHSSRSLERQCRRDIGLLWLTGMNYPDHNTLWRFWSDNKGAIKRLFKESVHVAMKNELVGMVYHAIDGTKVGANASRYKGLNKEEMGLLLKQIDEYVEEMSREVEERGDQEPDDRLPEKLQDAQELQKRIKENVSALQKKEHGTLSPVDMESRKMRTNRGTTEYSYNAQAVADGKTGIIVGSEVSQEETDNHLLSRMIEDVKETAGRLAAASVADAGYFSGKEIEKTEGLATEVYVNIPVEHNRSAEKGTTDLYHVNNFSYEKEGDVFICPQGCTLNRERLRGDYIVYECTEFEQCSCKSACTRSKQRKRIIVHRTHESIRRHKQKIAGLEAQALLRQRGRLVERVFGWIKEQYGLRRLLSRGLDNARAAWFLACTVYNLRKVWLYTGGVVRFT